jgi:Transmembrane domain of unknown function (DUF3566)
MTPPDGPSTGAPGDSTSTSVTSSGGDAPAAPRRTRQRRTVSSSAPPVEAVVAAAPVAPAAEAVLTDDETALDTRSTRRSRQQRQTTSKSSKPPKAAKQARRAPAAPRRFRQTIVRVDLWSVTKLSLCFYVSAMFVTLVAIVALWAIADAAGIIGSVEKFLGDLLSAKDFTFLSAEVLRGAILIALVVVALAVVITVVAASFFNIFAELFGGLEMTIKEEEQQPR